MLFPWIICCILLIIIILLLLKILFLKRSMKNICVEFNEHLLNQSNTLISISSNDHHIKMLATEINKQLRILRKQRREYVSGGRRLKETVTNISHDLRTPLTAIGGYLDLLDQEETSVQIERYIKVIRNRVELLNDLTEELFRYSLTAITDKGHKETIVLNEILEESIAGFYAVLKERNIEPIIKMPSNKVVRYLDPSVLARIFINLLHNAVKYSDGDLEIILSKSGEISFINTASGLDEIQVGKLFDRFYTVHNAEKSTGLGLGIARTLIEQLNGTISTKYKDNKLYIYLQLIEDNQLE